MRETYQYEKSREAFRRAEKVIPSGIYGHLGPAEGCYIPVEAFPFYSSRAEGTYLWDLDGNRFIDYMCAYGPNILGYHDPDVDAAAAAQRKIGDCTTLPSTKMIEFAELLVDTVHTADWAFFAKNGNDVTTLAVMASRAYPHRKKIVFFKGYYHGISPWTQKIDYAEWNNLEMLEEVFAKYKGEIAAVIGQPYMHGNFRDNEMPKEGFWQAVRKLCTDNDTVLVIDDVRAGFRLDLKGSDHYFGIEADLICFCKALANGYNVSALCGKDFLKNTISSMTYTGSYWLSAVPFAAGIACLTKMREMDLPRILNEKGTMLKNGLIETAKKYGYDLHVTGAPSLFYLRVADDPSLSTHQQFIAECVKRGVFFTNHHNHFINAALTEEDIKETIAVADEAFSVVRNAEM